MAFKTKIVLIDLPGRACSILAWIFISVILCLLNIEFSSLLIKDLFLLPQEVSEEISLLHSVFSRESINLRTYFLDVIFLLIYPGRIGNALKGPKNIYSKIST